MTIFPGAKCYSFAIKKLFNIKQRKSLLKTSPYFQNFDDFPQNQECLFSENFQKTIKNTYYDAFLDM